MTTATLRFPEDGPLRLWACAATLAGVVALAEWIETLLTTHPALVAPGQN